jgi:integrase
LSCAIGVRGSGRERTYTIGQFPDWTTTAARAKARELRRDIDDGGDPVGALAAEREAPTVAELLDRFEAEHLPRKRPGTAADYKRLLDKHVRPFFGAHTRVADVQFEDIDRLHRRITAAGSPYSANRVCAILSKAFSLSIRWNMRPDNPCRGIERNYEAKRKRYLSGDELARLTNALAEHDDRQAANIIKLLLLTGARKMEVLGARWADLDLTAGVWTKPGSATKQKIDHVAPLSAPARQLFTEIRNEHAPKHPKRALAEFVFPGVGGTGHIVDIRSHWRDICKAAGISGLRVHDLRHSFASQLASGARRCR